MDKILYIDDEQSNLNVFEAVFYDKYDVFVTTNTKDAYSLLKQNNIQLVVTDQRMPEENGIDFINRVADEFPHVIFMILSGFSDFDIVRKAINSGKVFKFLLKPWREDEIDIEIKNALRFQQLSALNYQLLNDLKLKNNELVYLKNKLEDENLYLKEEITFLQGFDSIISVNKTFRKVLQNAMIVAASNATVLITGETGTGKELVAKEIHKNSNRKDAPFISVNCAAIPEALFESEFFGHEKGAFTGAVKQRKGKFEIANGGTLFLDEVGEIPLAMQAKFLRALQENVIERIGGNEVVQLDVRIIAATNRNLEKEVNTDKFRSDLYYRLNVFPVSLPPLRERRDDIPGLVKYFIDKYNKKHAKQIRSCPKKNMDTLLMYEWPGNIRELENVIERSVVISTEKILDIGTLINKGEDHVNYSSDKLEDIESAHIKRILNRTGWKIGGKTGAAEILGLNRTTLIAKMKKLGIEKEK